MYLPTPNNLLVLSALVSITFAHPQPLHKRLASLNMGLASTYGAVSSSTLTSTGATVVTGSCGTCPGTSITGFPPGVCSVTTSAGGTVACDAKAACLTAYNLALSLPVTSALPSASLAGLTLTPGVYTFPSAAASLTGSVTLSGEGQFVFKIDTAFTTAAASKVVLTGGAKACDVYWVVGSSATVGAASELAGNILAYASVSRGVLHSLACSFIKCANRAATNAGTWCALNGAVTLINNKLTAQTSCVV
ncbi:hypothetical protein VTL71DRAFT_14161 [Oculimacula yallundae]|uniref:Antifreeze protein n=1 Tax=Oculimacula yallundae TaxID=86028 RepID=A0ABR4CJ15_9HELO